MLTTIFVMQIVLIVLLIAVFFAVYRKLAEKKIKADCEPIVYHNKGYFKHKIVAGYRMQFYHDDMPIGEPTERIVYYSNKIDKEAVQEVIHKTLLALKAIKSITIGIPSLAEIQDVINKALN